MRKHSVIVQKVIPPFRVAFFRALAAKTDMVVTHSRKKKNRTKAVATNPDFPNHYLRSLYYRNSDTALVQNLCPVLFRIKPSVVISDFALGFISFWILLITRRMFGFRLAVWTHGVKGNQLASPFSSRRDRFRLFLLNRVDGIIAYSEQRAEILRQHLRNPAKVFLARNTLDTGLLLGIHDELESIGRNNIREELGFTHRFNLLFMGRIVPGKKVDQLISEFSAIHKEYDVCLHIVGPGPVDDLVRMVQEQQLPVKFHGPVYDEKQGGKIMYASDLLVMPNAVGLAIVHAFSFGLPLLTVEPGTGNIIHGPEIEYLKPGLNGVLAKYGELVPAMQSLLSNPSRLDNMRSEALKTAREECPIDKMVEGFTACIEYLSKG